MWAKGRIRVMATVIVTADDSRKEKRDAAQHSTVVYHGDWPDHKLLHSSTQCPFHLLFRASLYM